MAVIIRWLFGGGLLVCLAFFAGHSLQRLATEQLFEQARNSQGIENLVLVKRAISQAPENYRYRRHRASVERRLGRKLSHLTALKQAASLRPAWPYTWTDLAMAYAELGELSSEFNTALSQSRALGYNSSRLAWKRAILAVSFLEQVEKTDTRNMLSDDLLRAYRSNRDKVLGYALLTQKVEVVCKQQKLHAADPELKLWCRKSPSFVRLCLSSGLQTPGVEKSCQNGIRYWRNKTTRRFMLMPDEFFTKGGQ